MKINHVTLLVKDKKISEKFYTNLLGFPKKEIGEHLWIQVGDQYIHLTQNSGTPVPNTFYHFAIEINGLPVYIKNIRKKGANVFDISEDAMRCFIRDLDDNLIEFIDTNNTFFK